MSHTQQDTDEFSDLSDKGLRDKVLGNDTTALTSVHLLIMTALPFGPGILPIPSTTSHWQRTVAGDPLATAGKNAPLPATADVVIIGSGLSGMCLR